jgi:hypothetical protein
MGLFRSSHPTFTTMSAPSIKSKDIYQEALPTDSDELQLVKFTVRGTAVEETP